MTIEELLNSDEYQTLLADAKEKQNIFYSLQDKETETRLNIEKHKKIIRALETETQEINQQLNAVNITEEVKSIDKEFKRIDQLNAKLSSNKFKIEAVRKAVLRSEIKSKQFINDEYKSAFNLAKEATNKVISLYSDCLLGSLINEGFINLLSSVFYMRLCTKSESARFAGVAKHRSLIDEIATALGNKIESQAYSGIPENVGLNYLNDLYSSEFAGNIQAGQQIAALETELESI